MIDELPEECACGTRLVWAISEATGIPIPLDAAPADGGGLRVAGMAPYMGRIRPVVRREANGRCRSHFALGACTADRVPNYRPTPTRRRTGA